MSDAIFVALVGFIAAIGGGIFQAWAHRNFESQKTERRNRTDAYLAYLNGISELSFAQNEVDKNRALSKIADARGRIALGGSPAVITAMVASFDFRGDLHSLKARVAHAQVITAMRADSLARPGRNEPDDLFVMLYGREAHLDGQLINRDKVKVDLPDWYPFANAREEEIAAWLAADTPPYDKMRIALPWMTTEEELEQWRIGMRAVSNQGGQVGFSNVLKIPLPPRRMTGRAEP